MCSAFSSGTSAHTYLSPFFLFFNHVINDQKLSETCSYLFLSLKCQQLSLLAATCPFLSPGSLKLRLLPYPTSTSGNPCSPHPRTAPASFFPSPPNLGQSLGFLSPPSHPLAGTKWNHPGVCAPAQLYQDGSFKTKLSPVLAQPLVPKSCATGWHLCMALHWTPHAAGRGGGTGKAHTISLPLTNTHR